MIPEEIVNEAEAVHHSQDLNRSMVLFHPKTGFLLESLENGGELEAVRKMHEFSHAAIIDHKNMTQINQSNQRVN